MGFGPDPAPTLPTFSLQYPGLPALLPTPLPGSCLGPKLCLLRNGPRGEVLWVPQLRCTWRSPQTGSPRGCVKNAQHGIRRKSVWNKPLAAAQEKTTSRGEEGGGRSGMMGQKLGPGAGPALEGACTGTCSRTTAPPRLSGALTPQEPPVQFLFLYLMPLRIRVGHSARSGLALSSKLTSGLWPAGGSAHSLPPHSQPGHWWWPLA